MASAFNQVIVGNYLCPNKSPFKVCMNPVSYTHLDVYKRQAFSLYPYGESPSARRPHSHICFCLPELFHGCIKEMILVMDPILNPAAIHRVMNDAYIFAHNVIAVSYTHLFFVPRSSASPLVCSSLNWPNWH